MMKEMIGRVLGALPLCRCLKGKIAERRKRRVYIRKLIEDYYDASHSFAQCGEDLIVNFIFENYLKIPLPTYLDIGAHHPTHLSNTYMFYLKGSRGVCIEPDPVLFGAIKEKRRRDICLNVGIGTGDEGTSSAEFYIMTAKTLNTFSKQEAYKYQSYGTQKIESVIQIQLSPINEIVERYFGKSPDFVSLDVEGMDLQILKALDFNKYRPAVFCVETLSYVEDYTEKKNTEIIDYMRARDYLVYADTFINTIFVDWKVWRDRGTSGDGEEIRQK